MLFTMEIWYNIQCSQVPSLNVYEATSEVGTLIVESFDMYH